MSMVNRVAGLLRRRRTPPLGSCLVCRRLVREPDGLQLRRRVYVHRECATYRMRQHVAARGMGSPRTSAR